MYSRGFLALTTGNSMTRTCASESEMHLQVSYRLWACKTDKPVFRSSNYRAAVKY